jgi:hypothetical protein
MKAVKSTLLGLALLGVVATAHAQNEQFIPMNGYWVGPYAPGGSGIFGGMIDYINMINAREGGVGGVKLTYEKCETEYNNARGVECYERERRKVPRARRWCTRCPPASPTPSSRRARRTRCQSFPWATAAPMPPMAACFRMSSR